MLNQWNTHPSLATRAYECHDFANSEVYQQILDGTYTQVKETPVEEEVVAAEVNVEAKSNDAPTVVLPEGFNIDAELARVNKELERYTCDAEKVDYAFAVISGIYSGILDAMFVGQCTITPEGIGLNHKQVNEFIQQILALIGIDDYPIFKRNRIANEKEDTEKVMLAASYLDERTVLEKLPFVTVDEVDKIMELKNVEDTDRFGDEGTEDNQGGEV
jgi:hypothetical protein